MMHTRAFISPEEVYPGYAVTYADLTALATGLNRAEALKFLGFLNLLVSSATTEAHLTKRTEPLHEVQTYVFGQVVGAKLLEDMKATFRSAHLLDRPILHRSQLLFAIRLVATHGNADGGNMLVDRTDFDAIGDLLFFINGLFRVEPATSKAAVALWLATQMGPLHETETPPTIELSWPRMEELFTQRLPAVADNPEEIERLQQVAVFTSGFSVQAWLDLSFMLFSFWSEVTFKDLMNEMGRGYLDTERSHKVVSKEILRRAVQGLGVEFAELPERLKIDEYSRSTLFDLTPFRAKPLWLMPDGLVLCIDTAFLMERVGPHAFWGVMNALDTKERRLQFTSAWGQAFENYCLDVLKLVFAGKKWSFVSNAIDDANNEELSDAVAFRDNVAVMIECKGTFIKSADKYAGVPGHFFRGLSKKFGDVKHGGVYQLVRSISRVWFKRVAHSPIVRPTSVTDIFPVLVVQDPIFGSGPVVRVLSDRFQVAIDRARRGVKHKTPHVWPLTVVTADDLDRISAIVQATSQRFDAILKRFHRTHSSRMVPLGDFLSSSESADFGLREKAADVVRARFAAGTQATIQRFRDAEYGGTPDVLSGIAVVPNEAK